MHSIKAQIIELIWIWKDSELDVLSIFREESDYCVLALLFIQLNAPRLWCYLQQTASVLGENKEHKFDSIISRIITLCNSTRKLEGNYENRINQTIQAHNRFSVPYTTIFSRTKRVSTTAQQTTDCKTDGKKLNITDCWAEVAGIMKQ